MNNKIRHIYDIHKLLKNNEINEFFNSEKFDEMLQKVGNDDIFSFKTNNEWLKEHPVTAVIFSQPKNTWKQLKNTYNSSFKELVYGDFPKEMDILKTLEIITKRLKKVEWKIK